MSAGYEHKMQTTGFANQQCNLYRDQRSAAMHLRTTIRRELVLSGFKSAPSQRGIYSTYGRRTPGVRLATGDQCIHCNSASDNVLLLITRSPCQRRNEQQNTRRGEEVWDRERRCVCVLVFLPLWGHSGWFSQLQRAVWGLKLYFMERIWFRFGLGINLHPYCYSDVWKCIDSATDMPDVHTTGASQMEKFENAAGPVLVGKPWGCVFQSGRVKTGIWNQWPSPPHADWLIYFFVTT